MSRTKSIAEAQRELNYRLQTVGAPAAFEAAMAVCEDTKAPAAARATASASILRAAGYFQNKAIDPSEKEQHEMSSEELINAIQELEDLADARERAANGLNDEDGDDIFK